MTEIGYALLILASALPFSLGWLAGIIIRIIVEAGAWLRIAFMDGYRKGRGL
jgi:hypothetical protein